MVLVNCSGRDDVYPLLDHASWHGLTAADLVFPSFLVLIGVSAVLSAAVRRAQGEPRAETARRALLRAAGLFAFGLLVNLVLFREAGGLRWPGVLQRIAVCSLGISGILLLDAPALEGGAAALLLLVYWLLMTRVPVPGYGAGVLTPEGNLEGWLDRMILGGHIFAPWGDQEGLLSTLPALATSLLGVGAGRIILRYGRGVRTASAIGAAGLLLAMLGWIWGRTFPLNKHLWTSSYALLTGGLTLAGLAGSILLIDERPAKWALPLEAMGRRALMLYAVSGLLYGIQEFISVRLPDGSAGNIKLWIMATVFDPWLSSKTASLAYALAFTALCAAFAVVYDARHKQGYS